LPNKLNSTPKHQIIATLKASGLLGPSEQKHGKPLVKKCQIASKNAKQAETGLLLLVLILPDE